MLGLGNKKEKSSEDDNQVQNDNLFYRSDIAKGYISMSNYLNKFIQIDSNEFDQKAISFEVKLEICDLLNYILDMR